MNRLFETHHIRKQVSLDGMWHFRMEGVEKDYSMPVPGCWEQHPDFFEHRGAGTYTRQVRTERDGNLRLEFKGVSHTADVYFDGEKVAHHYNAYTPFFAVLRNVAAGEHTLSVRVDSNYSEYSSLHIPNDYYSFGGISRPVAMEYVPDVYIKYIHFTPRFADGLWSGRTEVCLVNLSDSAKEVTLTTQLADITQMAAAAIAAGGETVVSFDADYPGVTAWDLENPKLYFIKAVVSDGSVEDDFIDRVGFRSVSYDAGKFCLNGKPVFLKGLNRHEDYALLGCAVPLQLMAHDLDLFKDLGANAVRTSHYPNDERFLDMCDERGILVWEENHARGLTLEQMQNPNFERQCANCIDEMIENHYNHPSIVIWAILNECASDTHGGKAMYRKQLDQIRALDQTRPLTFASCKYYADVSLDLPDIVSFNCYFDGCITEELNRLLHWIDTETEGANKPFIASEFGCEALYGYREPSGSDWSEEKQVRFLTENINACMQSSRVAGLFIWMFADCRISSERFGYMRPKGRNNKGVVDAYRRPKLSYHAVKELFQRDPYGARREAKTI